jgi:hypothetical protein
MADLLTTLNTGEWESRTWEGVSEEWELDCNAGLVLIGRDFMWPLNDPKSDQP